MSDSTGALLLLSINHENAAMTERERFALDDQRKSELYRIIRDNELAEESLILSTCNRFEIYVRSHGDHEGGARLAHELGQFHGIDAERIARLSQLLHGPDAIQHLIEVAAGLKSQIVGEAEIFGQVKEAYSFSQDKGGSGKTLNRVFQKAFQAAKLIRHSTSIGEGQINISNVAVDLSAKIFGDLSKSATLVLGTGEIGEKTVKALKSRGAERFSIASRSLDRAREAAGEWGGEPVEMGEIALYLNRHDIVIASTETTEPVITRNMAASLLAKRKDRPLFLVDLGLPRNIEQQCNELENVFLYNLDDLAAIADENLQQRRQVIRTGQTIAGEKAAQIWDGLMKRGLGG